MARWLTALATLTKDTVLGVGTHPPSVSQVPSSGSMGTRRAGGVHIHSKEKTPHTLKKINLRKRQSGRNPSAVVSIPGWLLGVQI